MATIKHLPSGNVRVQFPVKGLKLISRTFPNQHEALNYQARINLELDSIREADKAKLPVDMAVLFHSFHPDLQQKVQLLPMFAQVLGTIADNELTLSRLIDEFMYQSDKKDKNILQRLRWWSDHYGQWKVSGVTEDYIRHGLNKLLRIGSTGNSPISPQTSNRFKANLSSVFEFGKNKYHLKNNLCCHIRGKPEGKGRKRYLSGEEQQRFIMAAKDSP